MSASVDPLNLLREYAGLERRRCKEGLSPLEFQRWLDLDARLASQLAARRQTSGKTRARQRQPTILQVPLRTPLHFRKAFMHELSRGGLFVSTPFAAEIGTQLVLRVMIASTGQMLDLQGEVVSNNVSDGFSTESFGMGVHFKPLEPELRLAIDDLYAAGGDPEKEEGSEER